MKVNVTPKKEQSQAELKISVPADDFKPFVDKAARQLSKDHPIKGFRPGKASIPVIIQHFGQDRLLKEAMDDALPNFFVEAVLDNKIEAINRPSITIEKLSLDEPLEFTAIVDVLPEVTLGDPAKITAEKRPVKFDDKQIDDEIKYVAKMRSNFLEVARPAKEGDVVRADFTIKINDQVIEGGASKQHPIVLGEGRFIPEFEQKITGISAGDERNFEMTFPADYAKEDLRGQQAAVTVKAHNVQQRIVPEINDEFAKKLGNFTDLAHLKSELKKNISTELEQKEQDRFLGELAAKMAAISTFGFIPTALIEKEIDNRLSEFAQMLSLQQKTLDDYLQKGNKTLAQMRDDMRAAAEKNVKIGLVLRAFAEREKIVVTEAEVEEEANKHLREFKKVEQAKKHVDPQRLREHVESVLKNRKTLERLATLVAPAQK